MKGLNRSEEAALRAIAERHNLIAVTGRHHGTGSTSQLLGGIINGDVITVMLSDDQRTWLVEWLKSQPVDDPLYCGLPADLADQLAATDPPLV